MKSRGVGFGFRSASRMLHMEFIQESVKRDNIWIVTTARIVFECENAVARFYVDTSSRLPDPSDGIEVR